MVNGHLELVSSLLIRAIVRDVDTIEAVCVCGGGGGGSEAVHRGTLCVHS